MQSWVRSAGRIVACMELGAMRLGHELLLIQGVDGVLHPHRLPIQGLCQNPIIPKNTIIQKSIALEHSFNGISRVHKHTVDSMCSYNIYIYAARQPDWQLWLRSSGTWAGLVRVELHTIVDCRTKDALRSRRAGCGFSLWDIRRCMLGNLNF